MKFRKKKGSKDASSDSHFDQKDSNPASEYEMAENGKERKGKNQVNDCVEERLKKFKEYYVATKASVMKKASPKKLKKWKEDVETNGRTFCEKEGCNKALKSLYAMKYHYESNTCQKKHSMWKCLLCDKEVMPGSYTMYHHMCKIHFGQEYSGKYSKQESVQENSSNSDGQDRNSSFDYEESEEEKLELEEEKYKIVPLHKIEQKLKIFKKYFIAKKGVKKKASHKMLEKWNKELETVGKIICKNEDCAKPLGSLQAMIYHYEHAPCQKKYLKWKCLLCDKELRPGSRTMLHHMCDIHFELNPKKDTSMTNGKHYNISGRKHLKKSNSDNIKLTMDFYCKYKIENFMTEWRPRRDMWKLQADSEYIAYLPPLRTSVNVKIEKTGDEQEYPWFTLKCFESVPIKDDSSHSTFFVGGSVWAAAWCPTPIDAKVTQYIALATCSEMDKEHSLLSVDESKGLLQLWDLGVLGQNVQGSKPFLRLAVSHSHGNIWQMAWCPDGCWEIPSTMCDTDDLPRLGLLSVACADSYIRIYSIPHPVSLNCDPNCLPVYCSWPVAVLYAVHGKPCISIQKTMCTSVSWQRTDKCELIAGGFGNGRICIWNIKSCSTLLAKCSQSRQKAILPFLNFQAHKTAITCLDWAPLPGGRWLASSAFDADIRTWDLEDISLPLTTLVKTKPKKLARSIQWSIHWCGVFVSVDDCYTTPSSFYKKCGYCDFPFSYLSYHSGCTWTVSVSDWLNTEASGDVSGEVTATILNQMENNPKEMHAQRIPLFRTEIRCVEGTTQDSISDSQVTTEISELWNYEGFSKKYGLVFKDTNLHDRTRIPKEDLQQLKKATLISAILPSDYHMASINCVKWNPNFYSRLWLISVGHAGVARLSCVSGLHNSEAEDILEKHLRNI